ncbi:MAG: hypothetical protein ABIQ18_21695 [Umezawaea sp.]
MHKKLVLVAGAVVFGTLALASPAMAAQQSSAGSFAETVTLSDSGALGSPGSIAVPTGAEQ